MTADRKTVSGWAYHLQAPDAELTLSEFMALCLLHIRENGKEEREAVQHLEGMVGSIDRFLSATAPTYRAISERRGEPASLTPHVLEEARRG